MARAAIAYALWATLGWFGAHHFYLRRYRHGLVWLCTLGGFVCGWLRDLCVLGDYVKEANGDRVVVQALKAKRRQSEKPRSSVTRLIGEVVVGALFAVVYRGALSEDCIDSDEVNALNTVVKALAYATPIAVALGVHLVGNIGHHHVEFRVCGLAAVAVSVVVSTEGEYLLYNVIAVTAAANKFGKRWRAPDPGDRPVTSRRRALATVSACFLVYCLLWGSGLWFNTYITTADGERVRIKEAVGNFFRSPAWTQMWETAEELYAFWRHHGTRRLLQEFLRALDPEGESNAYKVLELKEDASEAEVRARCRALSRQHHPDRQRDHAAKPAAQARFIEVQQACGVLDKVRARRASKSRSQEEEL